MDRFGRAFAVVLGLIFAVAAFRKDLRMGGLRFSWKGVPFPSRVCTRFLRADRNHRILVVCETAATIICFFQQYQPNLWRIEMEVDFVAHALERAAANFSSPSRPDNARPVRNRRTPPLIRLIHV
jgi:hypothetical protein